jgi:hypothetical protein
MLPRWHIFWGAVFTLLLYLVVPGIGLVNLALVFLASFLIDFDHYFVVGMKEGKWKFRENLKHHEEIDRIEKEERSKGIKRRGNFHLFHTVEFLAVVGVGGVLWIGLFYVFIGMVFHSLLDVFSLLYNDRFYRREYFLSKWILKRV